MTSETVTDKKLIIITGASRSGTTLLSFILRNNEQVFGLKELHYFGDLWNPVYPPAKARKDRLLDAARAVFARQQFGVMAARITAESRQQAQALINTLAEEDQNLAGVFMAAVCKLAEDAGKSIPCLQTPRDIYYAETLLKLYPQAHVIHMLRDPRGVMASQKRRWQRRNLAADKSNFPLIETVRVWVNFHPYTVARLWLQATLLAKKLVGHERFTLVRFEDLLLNTEATLSDLCNRVGLVYSPAMFNVGQINSSHQSSATGARPGLNAEAIDAWRNVLTPAELAITEELCGGLMQEFDYRPAAKPSLPNAVDRLRYKLSYLIHLLGVVIVNPRRAWIQARALFIDSPVRRP